MMSMFDWGDFSKIQDWNLLYDSFLNKIIEIYGHAFPTATIKKCKKARKSGITRELLKII